jgi:hypothetical protein
LRSSSILPKKERSSSILPEMRGCLPFCQKIRGHFPFTKLLRSSSNSFDFNYGFFALNERNVWAVSLLEKAMHLPFFLFSIKPSYVILATPKIGRRFLLKTSWDWAAPSSVVARASSAWFTEYETVLVFYLKRNWSHLSLTKFEVVFHVAKNKRSSSIFQTIEVIFQLLWF